MWSAALPRRAGARLAAIYAIVFGFSVLALGIASAFLVDAALRRQIDRGIAAEMDRLVVISASGGGDALADAVRNRSLSEGGLLYRLESRDGVLIAGNLAPAGRAEGWRNFSLEEDGMEESADRFRSYTIATSGNLLTVADDLDELENTQSALLGVFGLAALLAAALAIGGGAWLSRLYLRRLAGFGATAEAITGGALGERMPFSGAGDEFDRLSGALNRMLDRNAALLAGQRQITSDIAHDIRTPLTRLRHKLETAPSSPAMESATAEADGLLAILSSLLRIAEIEEGARKAGFRDVDLPAIARRIEEAYGAVFEECGKRISVEADGPEVVRGDPELLSQLLSNLVENALVHTPAGTSARIIIATTMDGVTLAVRDDGPGVPAADLERIFRRFHRRDASRGLPGNGLGLSLAAAIAELHGAVIAARNLTPGFEVRLHWVALE